MASTLLDKVRAMWDRLTLREREVLLARHGIDPNAADVFERFVVAACARTETIVAQRAVRKLDGAKQS